MYKYSTEAMTQVAFARAPLCSFTLTIISTHKKIVTWKMTTTSMSVPIYKSLYHRKYQKSSGFCLFHKTSKNTSLFLLQIPFSDRSTDLFTFNSQYNNEHLRSSEKLRTGFCTKNKLVD